MDINSGLRSNAVRVIKRDDQQRIWLGTDQGLVILNDKDSSLNGIVEKFSEQQVYGLAFCKNHVFIGTRLNGLFIYDLSSRQLVKSFDTTEIGLCQRFKVLRDTVFFGTSRSAYYVTPKDSKWNLTKIKSADRENVFTDFTLWQGRVFACIYSHGNQNIYQFQNDSLVHSSLLKRIDFPIEMLLSLSLTSNDSLLVIGGDGFNIRIKRNQEKIFDSLYSKSPYKVYPSWDAEIAESRVYLALGNPDNNQQGMIYEPGKTPLSEVNESYYGLSLYFDPKKKAMWAGTLNKGLYYWPWINQSYYVPNSTIKEYKFKPINKDQGLLYNSNKVYRTIITNNEFVEVFDALKHKMGTENLDVVGWNDTTAILMQSGLFLVDGKRNVRWFSATQGNYIHKKGSFLYIFSLYYDFVIAFNLKNYKSSIINCKSNQIKALPYNNGNLIYSSNNTGFYYFDSTSHAFDIHFPKVESFAIQSDTLWTLHAGIVKTFKIDIGNYKLTPIFENAINYTKGFSTKWIIQNKGNIYCGNDKGFLRLGSKTGIPESYTYLGNYSKGKLPITDGSFIFFNQQNYITKLDPESSKTKITDSLVTIRILPDKTIYQNTPFIIHFLSEDYLIQKHSLKEVEIFLKGKLIRILYTIQERFEFPSGMNRGDYLMKFKVNGVPVGERKVFISIPLTANPVFYISITVFVLAFFFVLFKNILNKRTYDRRILENRLQLLKQTLNPHFIFNSLNLIYSLVLQRKNEAAIKTINNFSDLHRYYLDNINKPKITLEEELKFIESYLKLEAERVEVDSPFLYHLPNNLDEQAKSVLVPPMILQPLVENAVKYCGADTLIPSDNCIWIDTHRSGNKLIIGIENTIRNNGKDIHGSGTGLRLVNERIEIFNKTYKESILLQVTDSLKHCKKGYRCQLLIDI